MLSGLETRPEPAGPAGTDEIALLDLFIPLVKSRRLILGATLGMAALGLALCFVLPSKYTATTSILPPQQQSSSLMSQLGSLGSLASMAGGGGGSLGLKNPNDLQVAMFKSRTVEDAMVTRFHLLDRYHAKRESDARKALEHHVSIDDGAKDGLITLEVTDLDPRFAADMANGYVEEFKRNTAHLAVTEASQRRLFFEQQLAQAKDNLANAEEALKKTEQQTGMIQMDSQARAVISTVAQLRAQVAAKQVEIEGMETYATAENPELQTARQELTGLEQQLARTGASDELMLPHSNLQQTGLEYVRKLRDVKYYETIFDLIARQYEVAKVDEAKQGAIIQVVDRAVPPDHRSSPKRGLIVLGGAVFGLVLGILCVFVRRALERITSDPAEQERILALRNAWKPRRAS